MPRRTRRAGSKSSSDEAPKSGLSWLLERAFGGEEAAVTPTRGPSGKWPESSGAPGATELLQHLVTLTKRKSGEGEWVFLLGGAGNGKSYIARRLAASVGIEGEQGDIARRLYQVPPSGPPRLVLVNDATIATTDRYQTDVNCALWTDVSTWLELTKVPSALVNVNKGILIEEIRALERSPGRTNTPAKNLLDWLTFGTLSGDTCVRPVNTEGGGRTYYRQADLVLGRKSIRIHALDVDLASLLEPHPASPSVDIDQGTCVPLRVLGDFENAALERQETSVAGQLLAALVKNVLPDIASRPRICPLRANIESLQSPQSRAEMLQLLRAGEVVAGQVMTYRDFWGGVVLAMLGSRRTTQGALEQAPEAAVDRLLAEFEVEEEPYKRFQIIRQLAERRAHVALLWQGPIAGDGLGEPREWPFAEALSVLDGAADFTRLTPILESALRAINEGERPSSLVPALQGSESGWTEFDLMVEDVVLAAHQAEKSDARRKAIVSWYFKYIVRFASVFLGAFGHSQVIAEWMRVRNDNALTGDALDGLRRLLVYPEPNQPLQLPVLAPVTEPARDLEHHTTHHGVVVQIPAQAYQLSPEVRDERVWIRVLNERDQSRVAEVPLDFRLLREALACAHGSGFTEQGEDLVPRVERARASIVARLLRQQRPEIRFVRDGQLVG